LIQRNLNGVVSTIETSFGDSSTTSYSDTTLSPGDSVRYRIAAINSAGTASFSNAPPAVTTGNFAVPDQITDLALMVVAGNQVSLSWSIPADNGLPISKYKVYRSLNGAPGAPLESLLGDAVISYTDATLSPGDTATYGVRAFNSLGPGPFSNIPTAVTTSGDSLVIVDKFLFFPDLVTIIEGEAVKWRHTQLNVLHHLVSDDGTTFDAGIMVQGEEFTQTFTTAATVPYHCEIHPFIVGTIQVNP